jgi:hypothetical protein
MFEWLKRLVAGAELAELDELRERVATYEDLIETGRPLAPKSWAELNAEIVSTFFPWGWM